ncbi:MAG TPA: antibiotic biosynthesis monooxygenase family protein [Thermomicrobiaceae bacterium]|nr:antibiotic biosynthesis monooxygenase family protein [Thermomicrobiaceae bacterium]
MFVVAARYYAQAGKDDEIAAILREMLPLANAEPGCALYTVNRSTEDPRRFLLYEQYHDRAGYEAHRETAAFKDKILGRVIPLLESRVPEFYETL